jgi:hypothetical protein
VTDARRLLLSGPSPVTCRTWMCQCREGRKPRVAVTRKDTLGRERPSVISDLVFTRSKTTECHIGLGLHSVEDDRVKTRGTEVRSTDCSRAQVVQARTKIFLLFCFYSSSRCSSNPPPTPRVLTRSPLADVPRVFLTSMSQRCDGADLSHTKSYYATTRIHFFCCAMIAPLCEVAP